MINKKETYIPRLSRKENKDTCIYQQGFGFSLEKEVLYLTKSLTSNIMEVEAIHTVCSVKETGSGISQ